MGDPAWRVANNNNCRNHVAPQSSRVVVVVMVVVPAFQVEKDTGTDSCSGHGDRPDIDTQQRRPW
jgi:hypothetical protein